MNCPVCHSAESTVIDTRKYRTVVSRVRLCENVACQHLWSTKEFRDEEFNHKGYNEAAKNQMTIFEGKKSSKVHKS